MIDISKQTPTHDLDTEISCLESLLDDQRRLRQGTYPSADELAAATVIFNPVE